jgi:hypothetical protein
MGDRPHEEPEGLADAETGAHDGRANNEDDDGVSGHFLAHDGNLPIGEDGVRGSVAARRMLWSL